MGRAHAGVANSLPYPVEQLHFLSCLLDLLTPFSSSLVDLAGCQFMQPAVACMSQTGKGLFLSEILSGKLKDREAAMHLEEAGRN